MKSDINSNGHRFSARDAADKFLKWRLAAMFLLVVAIAAIARNTPAQNPPPPAPGVPVLEVNARLVVLDVTVTDKSGHPVNDLTRDDLEVFEDDQPQRIRSFDPPSAHRLAPNSSASGGAPVFDPAQPSAFGSSPVTVLVLDQLNTHFADSSFARRSLRDYLNRQPDTLAQPATLLTIFDNHFRTLQPFTQSRSTLLAALAAAPTEYAWKLEQNGNTDYGPAERLDQSLRALQSIAESYARIPGRKNIVWIGGGFPTLDPTTIDRGDAVLVKDTLQHVTNVLLASHVTLYAVDPTATAAGMTEITDSAQAAFIQAAGDSVGGGSDPFDASADFDKLGPVTGGRVVRGMNNIAAQISSAVSLGDDFYTLSYSPASAANTAAIYRKIRVICRRPGLIATTRTGYYNGPTRADTSDDAIEYDLTTAAESAVPLNALHVTVTLASPSGALTAPATPNAGHPAQPAPSQWNLQVGAAGLIWQPREDGGSAAHVQVMAVWLSPKGKMLGHALHSATANARAGADLHGTASLVPFSFAATPSAKTATVRFVVRDVESGRMGSFDLPLTTR